MGRFDDHPSSPFSYIETSDSSATMGLRLDAFATVPTDPIRSTRSTGWRECIPSFCQPGCQDITDRENETRRSYRTRERTRERKKGGGCNYVAGGCGPIEEGLWDYLTGASRRKHVVISGNWRELRSPRHGLILAEKIGILYRPPVIITRRASPRMSFPRSLSPLSTWLAELVYVFEIESKVIISVEE